MIWAAIKSNVIEFYDKVMSPFRKAWEYRVLIIFVIMIAAVIWSLTRSLS